MTRNSSKTPHYGKLSVGDVVTGGLRIYRDHFKTYFGEAFRSYLWVIIPVYGWAKFLAIQGLLGRLAFQEALEQPESILETRRQVMPRLWFFLTTAIAQGVFLGIALLGFIIIGGITGAIAGGILAGLGGENPVAIALLVLVIVVLFVGFLFGYIWLYSRLSLSEICLAIEPNLKPIEAIKRSWELTQGYVFSLQLIFFIAIILTIPLSIMGNIGTLITAILEEGEEFAPLIDLPLTLIFGSLLIPFWQSIKAVVYFDLRTRKEGLNLSLVDNNSIESSPTIADQSGNSIEETNESLDLAVLNYLTTHSQASFMQLLIKLKCNQQALKSRLLSLQDEDLIVIVEQLDEENTTYRLR